VKYGGSLSLRCVGIDHMTCCRTSYLDEWVAGHRSNSTLVVLVTAHLDVTFLTPVSAPATTIQQESVTRVLHPTQHITGHFGDNKSSQAIIRTGTINYKKAKYQTN